MIYVLENDPKEIPSWLVNSLGDRDYAIWYDFNISFHWDSEAAFKKLASFKVDDLLVTSPSFVGADNSFSSYLLLFYKLKEMGVKLRLAVLYTEESFYTYLLNFLSAESNYLKKEENIRKVKEILEFHVLYEIPYINYCASDLSEMVHISSEKIFTDYVETHRRLECTKFIYNDKIYPAYYIHYKTPIGDSEIVLYIEEDPKQTTLLLKNIVRVVAEK